MKVFINAGHYNHDPGYIDRDVREGDLTMLVRDEIKKLRPEWIYIPDSLDLTESIKFVNNAFDLTKDDIAVDIHFNSNKNSEIRGVEGYYVSNSQLATILATEVANCAKLPNRGAHHDSETAPGSLGWLRKTNCRSILIECAYLSNPRDRDVI